MLIFCGGLCFLHNNKRTKEEKTEKEKKVLKLFTELFANEKRCKE